MTKSKKLYTPEHRTLIWEKIRYYQRVNNISNEELAALLNVKPKTLLSYDKSADSITLAMIDNFVNYNHCGITYPKIMKDVFSVNDFMNA